jgi:hypothetical protein
MDGWIGQTDRHLNSWMERQIGKLKSDGQKTNVQMDGWEQINRQKTSGL